MATGQHNKKNWKEFKRMKELIAGNPVDVKLLREEIKENYYNDALKSLADVKRHMSDEFEINFFGRETMKYFGPHKFKFSKKDLTVSCIFKDTVVVYDIVWSDKDDNLELIHSYTER